MDLQYEEETVCTNCTMRSIDNYIVHISIHKVIDTISLILSYIVYTNIYLNFKVVEML